MKCIHIAAFCLFLTIGVVPQVSHAEEEAADRERVSDEESVEEELEERRAPSITRHRGVVVSGNADFGSTIQTGLGVSYSRVILGIKQGGFFEYGLGLNAALVLNEWRVDGLLIEAVGRGTMVWSALEFGLGLVTGGERSRATGSISILASWPYFVEGFGVDLGYRYQFPIFPFERPEWFGGHFFTISGHLPVWTGETELL